MVIASHNRERDRRREGVAMKFIIRVLPVVALLGATSPAFAVCSDPAGAAAVRAQCDCAGARNHGQYVSSVARGTTCKTTLGQSSTHGPNSNANSNATSNSHETEANDQSSDKGAEHDSDADDSTTTTSTTEKD